MGSLIVGLSWMDSNRIPLSQKQSNSKRSEVREGKLDVVTTCFRACRPAFALLRCGLASISEVAKYRQLEQSRLRIREVNSQIAVDMNARIFQLFPNSRQKHMHLVGTPSQNPSEQS